MPISRRTALFSGLAAPLAACTSAPDSPLLSAATTPARGAFLHGVASGDPEPDSIVLWTRVTTPSDRLAVKVEIAETPAFAPLLQTHTAETDRGRDHTVKIVPTGLAPGRVYYYRFTVGDEVSPIGRTRTLPDRTDAATFAIASCSNYPFGYFNAYDHIARDDQVDAVIHLGDYIYEYGPDGYGGETGRSLGREHVPPREIVSLSDYRARHAQYKADPSSRAMLARHPLICIWDDHETANNSWEHGAQNHQPETEGSWDDRRRAALRAYYEWMPVRDPEPGKPREALFREYEWGGLLSLAAIETRLMARSEQLEYRDIVPTLTDDDAIERFRREIVGAPSRELLGAAQTAFLERHFRQSVAKGTTWRLVANQIIMARLIAPNVADRVSEEQIVEFEKEWDQVRTFVEFTKFGLPFNLDAWDGYPAARERFYRMAQAAGARDLIVLTGDTHEFWGNDLLTDTGEAMGVELGTSGVTSPGFMARLGDKAFDYSLLMRRENRDIRYHDPLHHGYLRLHLTPDRGHIDYMAVSTILSPNYQAFRTARFDLIRENGTVRFGNPQGLGLKERIVYG
ncbi:alkaline phosphatase, putative [Parvularcula bermudensis HTCC2503]|uniref:Alkaline phosphatase, putative n=1 Tax=Parvularcula bermudensis (strain ATCC BAA-594 / HTCC2503 / KCTC 12087) TaxID=314260 RepID=E0TIA5_PARBH|nr:alkaline phosphatase D family protein [Parvularcula bermudensis]ADM09689.1 alkaline phosphatase, putative [Parvularcula bermudensis HTCC2503]